jgi:hypothetical protein
MRRACRERKRAEAAKGTSEVSGAAEARSNDDCSSILILGTREEGEGEEIRGYTGTRRRELGDPELRIIIYYDPTKMGWMYGCGGVRGGLSHSSIRGWWMMMFWMMPGW